MSSTIKSHSHVSILISHISVLMSHTSVLISHISVLISHISVLCHISQYSCHIPQYSYLTSLYSNRISLYSHRISHISHLILRSKPSHGLSRSPKFALPDLCQLLSQRFAIVGSTGSLNGNGGFLTFAHTLV